MKSSGQFKTCIHTSEVELQKHDSLDQFASYSSQGKKGVELIPLEL